MNTQHQHGLSLMEMMIAIFIGTIIVIGASELLLMIKSTYQYMDELSGIQENGRTLSHFLQSEIRTAGFVGCAKLTKAFSIVSHEKNIDLNKSLEGYAAASVISTIKDVDPRSHALKIQKMSTTTDKLISKIKPASALKITDQLSFQQGDYVVIADCRKADIFKVDRVIKDHQHFFQLLYTSAPVRAYQPGAQIGWLQQHIFYIASTGRKNYQGHDIYGLYLMDLMGQKNELAQNVNQMRILYDVWDPKKKQMQIGKLAEEVQQWDLVKVVKIYLLLSSLEAVHSKPMPYWYVDKKYQRDTRLYSPWSLWISLYER